MDEFILISTFILFVFSNSCLAVDLYFNDITGPLTWQEGFLDGECSTSPGMADEYIAPDDIHINTTAYVTEAWVGMYTTSSKLLTFHGCFFYEEKNINIDSVKNMSIENEVDPVGFCYQFCDSAEFGLSKEFCFCTSNVTAYDIGRQCRAMEAGITVCHSKYGGICGSTFLESFINGRCLCVYRTIEEYVNIDGPNECVNYDTESHNLSMSDCTQNKHYVCIKNTTNKEVVFFESMRDRWWNAAFDCLNTGELIFGNSSSLTRFIEYSNKRNIDSYWVNTFRKTFYTFVSTGEVDLDWCVALRNTSGVFTLFIKECNATLQALCNFSTTEVTTHKNNDATTGNTTSVEQIVNTSSGVVPIVLPVVLVVAGVALIAVVSTIICTRKTTKRKRKSSSKECRVNQGFQSSVAVYRKGKISTTYADYHDIDKRNTGGKSPRTTGPNINNEKEVNDPRNIPNGTDGIYVQLNEDTREVKNDDIYDHARPQMLDDNDTYNNCENVQSAKISAAVELSNYDSMTNIKLQNTEDGVYNSCVTKKPEVIEISEYDSMANIRAETEGAYGLTGEITSGDDSTYDVHRERKSEDLNDTYDDFKGNRQQNRDVDNVYDHV